MGSAPIRSAIAIDVGTTNTRARFLLEGRVLKTTRRSVGIRDAIGSSGRDTLAVALRDAIEEVVKGTTQTMPDVMVASGMLTSEVGLVHVPHVPTPAGKDELARGAILQRVPAVADQPILFIPGVRTRTSEGEDGWASADLMRGEECETLGAWETLEAESSWEPGRSEVGPPRDTSTRCVFLWPGSHTKLVEVDDGKIVQSHTTLTGELTMALARHTLLSASLPAEFPNEPDPKALEMGVRLEAREGLGRAAFLVRIAAITDELSEEERASFLIGAVLADDVNHLVRHPMFGRARRVWVGGRQPQRTIYAELLQKKNRGSVMEIGPELSEEASARGALAIAIRYQELRRE